MERDNILIQSLNDNGIPSRMHGGIIRYISNGIPPGDFLSAIICNDLKESCSRADDENQKLIFNYVKWFYNFAPLPCWGSREKMNSWIAGFSNAGAINATD